MGIEELGKNLGELEILENKYKHAKYTLQHEFPELTAVCPVTRLPDFYNLYMEYEPDVDLVELKSFKLYLNSFRDKEILHEEITNEILEKFVSLVKPRWCTIIMKVRVRGGIETTVTRKWSKKSDSESFSNELK